MRLFRSILVLMPAAALCAAQELPPAVERTVSYEQDVHPILAQHCYKCHGSGNERGGLRIESRELLLEGADFGPVVTIGNSAESRLIEVVAGLDPELIMPEKGPRLTAEEIGILRAWIDQGLVWDWTKPPIDAWTAPLSLTPSEPPPGPGIHESYNPIDQFLRAYFDEHEMAAPGVVSDAQFARRAYLDAVGLLPTPAQLETFLAQSSRRKRQMLVRDLLDADRDYAEHWMTFWNDHLRNDFTGTGYIDGGRKQITGWLYSALYYNRPYDEFVRELIHPSEASRGFTDGIVWRGVVPAAESPPVQAARSVAQVFLGVNLKCASCHDSFVDNWKLEDAWGMAAFFSSGPLELVRCDNPTGRTADVKFLWPELGSVDPGLSRGERMKRLADIVTQEENGRFARTFVNRVWARLLGRGLIEPLDDMGRKPWHPELLEWLASDFVQSGYDVKHLLRTIMSSRAYQLESFGTDPQDDAEYVFRGPDVRRLSAEQFVDALSRMTGVWQADPKFAIPDNHDSALGAGIRAWRIPSDMLTRALGRPNREQVVTWRQQGFTTLQALEMTNGEVLAAAITRGALWMGGVLEYRPEELVDELFERALQRPPTNAERAAALELAGGRAGLAAIEDLLWAVAMLPEFQLIY